MGIIFLLLKIIDQLCDFQFYIATNRKKIYYTLN